MRRCWKQRMTRGLTLALVLSAAASAPASAGQVSVGRSGWAWSDPYPQGETLNQVAFQGARGYADGNAGTVLRSDDAGHTWSGLSSGTEADLTLLQEVDPSTVLVGGGCTVRESTDSGVSFHRVAVNPSERSCASKLAGLSFLSATTGYVELADGTMLFTTDGGVSVQQKTPVPLGGGTAEQIRFLSPSTGLAVVSGSEGGRIYRTTDGAGSWTQVGSTPANEPLFSVYFASPTTAYAVGGGLPLTVAGPPARNGTMVLLSEDEGKTWAERKPPSEPSEPKSIKLPAGTPPLALRQIACSDPLHCAIATGTKSLVRTEDGAISGALVTPSEASIDSLAFTSGTNLVAVGEGGATVLSPDGGATFPTQVSRSLATQIVGPVRIGASAQDAYAPGAAGTVAATTDGGAEWATLHVPTSASIAAVAFATAQDGYALDAKGTLFRTANGGQSWAIEGTVGEAPARLLAPSAGTVLLIGPTGVRRSTDGGASFTRVQGSLALARKHRRPLRRSLSSLPLFAGAELAGGAVIAWGDEAAESTDGGSHWRLIPRPLARGNVEAASFLNATTGYVVSRRRLFFTRDAGRRWSERSSLGTQSIAVLAGLSFSGVADGYAVAHFNGRTVVMATRDGGRSWTPELLPRTIESLAAGGAVDYAQGGRSLFQTSSGGLAPNASSLKLIGPSRLSRAKLRKAHGRVRLKGRLTPASGGETVVVSYRANGRSAWVSKAVTVASNGDFSAVFSDVTGSGVFVAQWAGAGSLAGAGTPALALAVAGR